MSNENLQRSCKQRFKGVENFLRRVAFNLGNTASQTEVKIISCIPIDVTDLQQKIISLEKQLHEAKQQKAKPVELGDKAAASDIKPSTVVNTAIHGTSFTKQSNTLSYCNNHLKNNTSHQAYSCDCTRQRNYNDSAMFAATSTLKDGQTCSYNTASNINADKEETNQSATERYINIFKKRKRKRDCNGKSKMKTHLIYFAQHAQNNPFYTNEKTLDYKSLYNILPISQAYLDSVIRRQYDPKFVLEEFSDTSNFSRPICRDTCESSRLYESDVCSCCHGQFQNIDNYMTKSFDPINKLRQHDNRDNANKMYYDSNLYDVVPVKESPSKFVKEAILPTRKVEIKCWPEHYRSKYRYSPITVNYQTEISPKRCANKSSPQKKIYKGKLDQHKQYPIKEQSIDCDNIYEKNYRIRKLPKSKPVKTILLKNKLIETDDINILLNNQSTQLELIPDDNKTESTLNQIKSILQSVLAEVKTNATINTAPEKALKKDAIVQKEASQNTMQGNSTLLHSFTYNNSYNTNPYLPSCSRQVPAGQYCVASIPYQLPAKCLQNYPLFIHPPSGRCTCYYRNNSNKSSSNKQATTATTINTDKEIQRSSSKETEKLIKEIYKSLALTADFPTKDNSVSEYDDLKSSENNFTSDPETKDVKNIGIEVVDKRDIEVEALISPNTSNNSKLVYTATSTQSEDKEATNESCFRNKYAKNIANLERQLHRFGQHNADIIIEDDEETNSSSNETENNDNVDTNEYNTLNKNKKKGLIERMFKSVKLFRKRNADQTPQYEEAYESSDTEDYETIYSDRTTKSTPSVAPKQDYKHKIHPNVKNFDQSAVNEKARMSPYMEQEYRRQWNERMMYDKAQKRKYSSERPFSNHSTLRTPRPVYWNNYEARSVILGHQPTEVKYHNSNIQTNAVRKTTKNDGTAKKKLPWLKKHKLGVNCGEQWKKLVFES